MIRVAYDGYFKYCKQLYLLKQLGHGSILVYSCLKSFTWQNEHSWMHPGVLYQDLLDFQFFQFQPYCWRNPANQLRLLVYPIICSFFFSPKVSGTQNGGILNLIRLFWGWVFPYISRIHTAYTGEDSSILGTWHVWWFLHPGGYCSRISEPSTVGAFFQLQGAFGTPKNLTAIWSMSHNKPNCWGWCKFLIWWR